WVASSVAEQVNVGAVKAHGSQIPESGNYILLLGKERVSPASRATKVQTLGLRDLRSLIRDNPSAIGAAAKEFKQVRFIGPNFDIRPSTASAKTNLAFRTPAVLSFHVDRGQDAEQYRILHLLPAATTWIEAKS